VAAPGTAGPVLSPTTIHQVEQHGESETKPDVDELVAALRARVEERRRSGAYPPGLEDDLAEHFRRILRRRAEPRSELDLRGPIRAAEQALPLEAARIPSESGVPGGQALHRSIARVVGRQTQGVLEQVQGFAQPVTEALTVLAAAVEELAREVRVDVGRHIDAIYERQAAYERALAQGAANGALGGTLPHPDDARPAFQPWYSTDRFDEEFRGSRDEMLQRYRDLAERLVSSAPVVDLGCGRGEFLELLSEMGIDSWGIDHDPELVKQGVERGLRVEHDDALRALEGLDEASLGGLVLIQLVEHLSAQEVVDLVALAADKIRAGGQVFVETVNPQSLYVFAHSFYLDPTHLRPVHPAYLAFLFREAGFSQVDIEWRSPPPSDDVLEEAPPPAAVPAPYNENVRRLNQLLFAPQDYLVVAIR
jgi:2-polyprenyl-3-methyl-5-hydroxy-6-metoxy-1,4-benzoquinol methylase